ncbi:MAG: hypothetical protein N2035_04250 [Chthoniobacterales bacterium]|nr:hypothetical protein [Chthoniobacterales bacterium]
MHVIHHALEKQSTAGRKEILIRVDRLTLGKCRWRATADDGTDFGFDLQKPLRNGDFVYEEGEKVYRLSLLPEEVLEVELPAHPADAALLGWKIGNLHFPIEIVGEEKLRIVDDPAVRQLLEREARPYQVVRAIFQPLSAAPHSHSHHHRHDDFDHSASIAATPHTHHH